MMLFALSFLSMLSTFKHFLNVSYLFLDNFSQEVFKTPSSYCSIFFLSYISSEYFSPYQSAVREFLYL